MTNTQPSSRAAQRGASLLVVLLILMVVTVLGLGSAQIAMMGERGARNDRDLQVAWQAADAALLDAEADMMGSSGTTRGSLFDGRNAVPFLAGCGIGQAVGLCSPNASGKPVWLTVDFEADDDSAKTTAFGAFTDHGFAAGAAGVQPARVPRYVIELIPDPVGDMSDPAYLYRVTAMGFGPRADIQAVLQTVYRK